jgi:hypothetical protein
MNSSWMSATCSVESPSLNTSRYQSKSVVLMCSCVARPNLHMRRFYAAATVGSLLCAFFTRRLLRIGKVFDSKFQ